MHRFIIHPDNRLVEYSAQNIPEGAMPFASETELAAVSASWPASMYVEIWNRLPGVKAVTKFRDRKTAINRIWKVLTMPSPVDVHQPVRLPKEVEAKAKKEKQEPLPKAETKTDKIIALLKRPEGATLKVLMTATAWQAHSVRGFISAHLSKRMNLKVKSFKSEGERVYRIRP